MRKRNRRVQVRLTEQEYRGFLKWVGSSGLSQEEYLRQLLRGLVPRDLPPPDYQRFMEELYQVGSLLRQLSHQAQALGAVDAARCESAVEQFRQLVEEVTAAVISPRRL